jgi:hypothetical protein
MTSDIPTHAAPIETPLIKTRLPNSRELRQAIEAIVADTPHLRTEKIRIEGARGLKAMLTGRGVSRSTEAIRRQLKAMGLRSAGRGSVNEGVRSREELDRYVNNVVTNNPQWDPQALPIRGIDGLKAKLLVLGIRANQVTIVRALARLGYKARGRGFVPRRVALPHMTASA